MHCNLIGYRVMIRAITRATHTSAVVLCINLLPHVLRKDMSCTASERRFITSAWSDLPLHERANRPVLSIEFFLN